MPSIDPPPVSVDFDLDLSSEINVLVSRRAEHRRKKEFEAADTLRRRLLEAPYRVEVADLADGTTRWTHATDAKEVSVHVVVWEKVVVRPVERRPTFVVGRLDQNDEDEGGGGGRREESGAKAVPLTIVTVNSPPYRARLAETLDHLTRCGNSGGDSCGIDPLPIDLLDLSDHPTLGLRRILAEGWRRILLPVLLRSSLEASMDQCRRIVHPREGDGEEKKDGVDSTATGVAQPISIALVAEDDVRFPADVNLAVEAVRLECEAVFASDPTLDVLSFGHSWTDLRKHGRRQCRHRQVRRSDGNDKNGWNDDRGDEDVSVGGGDDHEEELEKLPVLTLLEHLRRGGKVHGTTLLALACPEGIERLSDALDGLSRNSLTHLDQMLFHSNKHDINVALRDPPLVGWAEVGTTLTGSGTGHRRKGGGRRGFLPPVSQIPLSPCEGEVVGIGSGVQWVRRCRVKGETTV